MSTDVLAIIAIALGALTRALGSDLPGFKSLSKAWRAVIVAGLGIVQGIVDMAAAGTPIKVAAVSVAKTTVPSLVLLVIEALFGGGGTGPDAVSNGGGKAAGQQPSPYGAKLVRGPWARVWIGAAVVAMCCATGCASLGGVIPVLQDAILVAEDGQSILQALRAAFDFFSATNILSQDVQVKAQQAFQDAALALDAAVRALHGGKELDDQQIDAAFEDFRQAYTNLVAILRDLGVVQEKATGLLAAKRGDKDVVLIPLAFKVRGHQ